MRILLVDDDKAIAQALATVLTEQRHIVNIATDGQAGWDFAQSYTYDLIVLDVMLPKLDGVSLCQQLRRAGYQMPILLLTARDTHTDKVKGLDAGADDYVVKPFDWSELLARIRALLRREGQPFFSVLRWGDLCLNPATCDVTYQDQPLTLRPKEYSLLELFLRNPRRIFSCGAILEYLWSLEDSPGEETVRAHIKGLRHKLKTVGVTDFIETIYGLGYRLKAPERREEETAKVLPSASLSTLQEALTETWEAVKPKVLKQVMAIEQATAALQAGRLSRQLQQQARREAHTLAGLVGCFGFHEGSSLSRQIENLLESESALEQHQAQSLQEWVTALRQELIGSPKKQANEQPTDFYQQIKKKQEALLEQSQTLQQNVEKTKNSLRIFKRSFSELVGHFQSYKRVIAQGSDFLSETQVHYLDQSQLNTVSETYPLLLIVDNDAPFIEQVYREGWPWRIHTEAVTNPSAARHYIANLRPDILLLNLCQSETLKDGLMLLAELKAMTPPLPVLVLTSQGDVSDRLDTIALGLNRSALLYKESVSPTQVLAAVSQVLQQTQANASKILIVDNDPQMLSLLKALLKPGGLLVRTLTPTRDFWDALEQESPDLLLLDVDIPDMSGIELCRKIRNHTRWAGLPVLFLTARTDRDLVQQMFMAGADDFVSKPIVGPELLTRIMTRIERSRLRGFVSGG